MKVQAPISNYYGSPLVSRDENDKPFLALENWDGWSAVEISEALFNEWVRLFGPGHAPYRTFDADLGDL